ncbi:invasion associated locus B family protein [Tianweitania sediminis]|uniref:Invasion associated locus B family protein n=2 Tax=Tianweitania sediminis TaxID=1502156 RepID=A0A8J7UND6_9HYPH|nr:invasion associated locus B family protein [Tianweitania sediminis]MBP0441382.1 invasion associated locus B family protein [Tianweitania sediminis]
MRTRHHVGRTSSSFVLSAFAGLLLTSSASGQQTTPTGATAGSEQAAQLAPDQPAAPPPTAAAAAERPVQAAAPVKPWNVRCSEGQGAQGGSCQMFQTLANPKGERVLAVSIRKRPQGLSMVMALPHGLHLPGGVVYQVDGGQKKSIPIEASDDKGVYAVIPMNEALLASMKRGNTFNVTMTAMNRRPVSIPMTLSGFTAAADELVAKQ